MDKSKKKEQKYERIFNIKYKQVLSFDYPKQEVNTAQCKCCKILTWAKEIKDGKGYCGQCIKNYRIFGNKFALR